MDPIKEGSSIFLNIFEQFPSDKITDLNQVDNLLTTLLAKMRGLVIVDFMDSGNWDQLGSYAIDYETEYLILRWHRYNNGNFENYTSDLEDATVFTVLLHFKDLIFGTDKNFPFITIRGFSIKEKEILNYFRKQNLDIQKYQLANDGNFCQIFEINHPKYRELCFCLNTPIYSILIVPKNTAAAAGISAALLFLINYDNCLQRLKKALGSLNSRDLDEDEICEKANTARRVFEYVLKIECCYCLNLNTDILFDDKIDKRQFVFNKSYSDTLLGQLVQPLKQIKDVEQTKTLNSIVRLANELSHDSGIKIIKEKTQELLNECIKYTEELSDALIKKHIKQE